MINTAGSAGNIALLLDVPLADLASGLNTLEMLPLNAPMDYPPAVGNTTDIVIEPGDEGVARIKELTNGIGADGVLECVGTQESMMRRSAPCGRAFFSVRSELVEVG